jgi:hypothetical protein
VTKVLKVTEKSNKKVKSTNSQAKSARTPNVLKANITKTPYLRTEVTKSPVSLRATQRPKSTSSQRSQTSLQTYQPKASINSVTYLNTTAQNLGYFKTVNESFVTHLKSQFTSKNGSQTQIENIKVLNVTTPLTVHESSHIPTPTFSNSSISNVLEKTFETRKEENKFRAKNKVI